MGGYSDYNMNAPESGKTMDGMMKKWMEAITPDEQRKRFDEMSR